MRTMEQVMQDAAPVFGAALLRVLSSDPREAAIRAYIPKVTPPIEELEARVRQMQAERLQIREKAA